MHICMQEVAIVAAVAGCLKLGWWWTKAKLSRVVWWR